MSNCRNGVLLLGAILICGVAGGKPKKEIVSAVFQNARFAYVESFDGDAFNPNLYPEDRQAIFDVQDRLRDWNRYAVALRRQDADLVFMVRRGRVAAAKPRIGISNGPRTQPGTNPGQTPGQYPAGGKGPIGRGANLGVGAEVGPGVDMLRVFTTTQDGKLIGPIWQRELDGGLDAPDVELIQQLKAAVEKTYPQSQGNKVPRTGASQPAPQPPQGQQPVQPPPPQPQL